MEATKIRQLDAKELAAKVTEIDEQIFRLKFQMSMGQMDGLKKYRELRKDRARVYTIQRERELAAAKGGN
jgi:large subunit ribosomal protein L29